MKKILKKIALFFANPRLLLCCGLAWMITNGWAYVFLGLGPLLGLTWMTAIGGAYLSFLWLPITPEKLVTIPLAIGLLKLFFPKDKYTLGVLNNMWNSAKNKAKKLFAKEDKKR